MELLPQDHPADSELQRLLQKRALLMLERDIARKGRQARRELDRAARVQSKKTAKALAVQAGGEHDPAGTAPNQLAEEGGSWISRAIVQPILGKLSGGRKNPGAHH